jgi:DNA-binding SARP family transcriptional activator
MRKFHILGQLRLLAPDGGELRRAVAGDLRLALLAYLAFALPGTRRRDAILPMFWPEADAHEARHRLRQLLYVLRSELGPEVLVTNGREQVGLAPGRFWCDAVAFDRALGSGLLEEAQALYAGPLCEGLYVPGAGIERWLDRERERLHDRATESAWELCLRHDKIGDLHGAIRWGSRAVELRPDEARLCSLLALCGSVGDRLRGLRLFARYEQMLRQEYDLAPAIETVRLVRDLQEGRLLTLRASAASSHPFHAAAGY